MLLAMKFRVEMGEPTAGRLFYDEREYSFRFEALDVALESADQESGVTSLLIGTLGLQVGVASGRVYFVEGLHEVRGRWSEEAVDLRPRPGVVRVQAANPLQRASARTLAGVGQWRTFVDGRTGWVAIKNPTSEDLVDTVTVATGTVLGLSGDGRLSAVWLRPSDPIGSS